MLMGNTFEEGSVTESAGIKTWNLTCFKVEFTTLAVFLTVRSMSDWSCFCNVWHSFKTLFGFSCKITVCMEQTERWGKMSFCHCCLLRDEPWDKFALSVISKNCEMRVQLKGKKQEKKNLPDYWWLSSIWWLSAITIYHSARNIGLFLTDTRLMVTEYIQYVHELYSDI